MSRPFELLSGVVQKVFARCQVGTCNLFSLGVVCARCSRRMCLRCGYVTLGAPPTSVCASCIISDHPELLRDMTMRKGTIIMKKAAS